LDERAPDVTTASNVVGDSAVSAAAGAVTARVTKVITATTELPSHTVECTQPTAVGQFDGVADFFQ
jgi:hypothetical protein